MKKKELIEEYVKLKTQIRMQDAQECTSYAQEFAHCYRMGCPNPAKMTKTKLRAQIAAAKATLSMD